MRALLEIENLTVAFPGAFGQIVTAVKGISLSLVPGEIVGLVGESGSGKSVTALSVLGLVAPGTRRLSRGRISFRGRNLLACTERELEAVRGREIAMVFQEPMTSLNPSMRIGDLLAEVIATHAGGRRTWWHRRGITTAEARRSALASLQDVQIPDPQRIMRRYPHELSGGMRQRVLIAMAMASNPRLLICDEPTTALDVTIQAQILRLIVTLSQEHGTAVLFITHDLGVVSQLCDRVAVMQSGYIVEEGPVEQVLTAPAHPYTQSLLKAVPDLDECEVLA